MRPARLSLTLLLFTLLPWSAAAQFETATVVGTVRDTSGAVVAEARVSLTNLDTGVAQERTSDAAGNVEFFNVRIGRYVVTADKSGFSIAVVDNLQVTVGARQRVDIVMAVGQLTEKVEVVASSVQLQTDSSDRGQVISGEVTRALPLNGREYSQLALLSPGVRLSALNTGGFTPREGSFNVNGLRSTFNNFLIDGVDNNAYGTSNQGFSNQVMQPSPDAVAEFKVVTNNTSAEYGRSAGATINVAYNSGTNQFRGIGLGLHPPHRLQCRRLLQAGLWQATLRPRSIRRRGRRAGNEEPGVLLRRRRILPPGARAAGDLDDSHAGSASGRARRGRPPSADRRDLSGRDTAADDRLRPRGAHRAAGADRRWHQQQLRHPTALRQRHRQGRWQARRRRHAPPLALRPDRLARRGHPRRPADPAALGR